MIDKKRVEEFEKKNKDAVLGNIREVGLLQFAVISQIMINAKNLGISQINLPNACTTINNKIVEVSQMFTKSGISMFSQQSEKYDVVSSSLLGDAIIFDLMDKLAQSIKQLKEYSNEIQTISDKTKEQILALQNISPIRKFFSKIKGLFVKSKPVSLSITKEEQDALDKALQGYIDSDSEIWNYSLEDNIVQALVDLITGLQPIGNYDFPHYRYSATVVPEVLNEFVIPDLSKLGFEHLVPKLKEDLIEAYKKDLPDPNINPIEDEYMYLYVPDFSKETEKKQKFRDDLRISVDKGKNATTYIEEEPSQEKTTEIEEETR